MHDSCGKVCSGRLKLDIDKICQIIGARPQSEEDIMPTMNVSLPPELAQFVEQEVADASGGCGTGSEIVRESLRLLRREKAIQDEKLAVLRREVGIGVEQARDGRLSTRSISEIVESLRSERFPPIG